jgi:hypothetical protein
MLRGLLNRLLKIESFIRGGFGMNGTNNRFVAYIDIAGYKNLVKKVQGQHWLSSKNFLNWVII